MARWSLSWRYNHSDQAGQLGQRRRGGRHRAQLGRLGRLGDRLRWVAVLCIGAAVAVLVILRLAGVL